MNLKVLFLIPWGEISQTDIILLLDHITSLNTELGSIAAVCSGRSTAMATPHCPQLRSDGPFGLCRKPITPSPTVSDLHRSQSAQLLACPLGGQPQTLLPYTQDEPSVNLPPFFIPRTAFVYCDHIAFYLHFDATASRVLMTDAGLSSMSPNDPDTGEHQGQYPDEEWRQESLREFVKQEILGWDSTELVLDIQSFVRHETTQPPCSKCDCNICHQPPIYDDFGGFQKLEKRWNISTQKIQDSSHACDACDMLLRAVALQKARLVC